MNPEIEAHREELNRLCTRFGVSRMELFGSGAGGGFDAEHSDLDFLVDFLPMPPGKHARSYFGLLEALQELYHRPVDLVEIGAVHNPYFQAAIDRSRVLLYAA